MKSKLQNLRLREKYGTEKVFVVPYFETKSIKDKISTVSDFSKYMDVLEHGRFIDRADAEGEIALQQIIPYGVFTYNNKFFVTRRIGGEERLRGKYSLGIGGHINPCDKDQISKKLKSKEQLLELLNTGLDREIREEVEFSLEAVKKNDDITYKKIPYGTVRDLTSTTPDHIGFVYMLEIVGHKADLVADTLAVKEKDTLEGFWLDRRGLANNFNRFESWAQFIILSLLP